VTPRVGHWLALLLFLQQMPSKIQTTVRQIAVGLATFGKAARLDDAALANSAKSFAG
jgi:hypothetical protein